MPIIKEYISERGNTIRISNDAFINCSPEEIERRKAIFDEACYKLLANVQEKRNKGIKLSSVNE